MHSEQALPWMRGIDSRKSTILTRTSVIRGAASGQPVLLREHQSKRPAGRFSHWSLVTALTVLSKRWKLKPNGMYHMSGRWNARHKGRQTRLREEWPVPYTAPFRSDILR
jgi:hypothetical protein